MFIETKWVFSPVEGSSVEKINLPFFYQLGAVLNPLTSMQVTPQNRLDFMLSAIRTRVAISELFGMNVGLSVCIPSAGELNKAIAEAFEVWDVTISEKDAKDYTTKIDRACKNITEKAKTFETVLSQELPMLSAYYVTQTGIYKTSDLVDGAAKDLPESVLDKLNDSVIFEITQAGRCLAFDVPTACGFHMLRATEEVLHGYYISLCKPKSKKKLPSWAGYITALHKLIEDGQCSGEIKDHVSRVLALLRLVKDQDRNLIMHPEVVLTTDQAHILFKTTQVAILAMADKLEKVKRNAKAKT